MQKSPSERVAMVALLFQKGRNNVLPPEDKFVLYECITFEEIGNFIGPSSILPRPFAKFF